jgi:hypothetical protein
MSLLKVNEVQNYNGSSLTLTASTVSTSAQLNTGGNISVTGSLNVSDDSTTRSNLGLGTIATQDSNNVSVTGGTIGSDVVFPAGLVTHTVHAFEVASNWIETTSTSDQASGIIINAGTAGIGESVILNCTIRNASAFQADLTATYYQKIGTGGTYSDILANGGIGGGERFFLKYYSNYPFQPFTMFYVHTAPSTSDDNYYQIYFKSGTSGQKARLAWFSSGIEIIAQRVKLNSSTDLNL